MLGRLRSRWVLGDGVSARPQWRSTPWTASDQ